MRIEIVRTLTPDLIKELNKHTNPGPDSSQMRTWLRYIPERILAALIYAEPNHIVGWAALRSSWEDIGVYVDEEYRKQGFATKALDTLLQDKEPRPRLIRYDDTYEGNLLTNAIQRAGAIPRK